ncbi:MAG TPA: histidine kinase [Chryseolinea sp.]
MNFFALDTHGELSYVNVNDPHYGFQLVSGDNLWEDSPAASDIAFHQACLRVLRDQEMTLLETYESASGTWWQTLIYPMPGGVAVYSSDTTQTKRLEKQLIEKERELEEAQKEIRLLALTSLRSAINANFILTTINAIQHYVIKNEGERAINYLSSFSKLVRSVLSSAMATKTRLADELEFVRHYVRLEQMRVDYEFMFEIKLTPGIDLNATIPPMIIQPFVENAIHHGFNGFASDRPRELSLRVANERDHVSIIIEDNGAGREMHAEDKTTAPGSSGAIITAERLRLMSMDEGISIQLVTRAERDESPGTTITIAIPYAMDGHS